MSGMDPSRQGTQMQNTVPEVFEQQSGILGWSWEK